MTETTTIARPYAKAAFEAAGSKGEIDGWARFLAVLAEVIDNPEVNALFDNPQMNSDRIKAFLEGVMTDALKDGFGSEQRNFLTLLLENGRLKEIPGIRRQFDEMVDRAASVATATIESAFPIDEEVVSSLVSTLEAHFKCRIKAEVVVDPSLIGGAKIVVGDAVIDASVREKLNSLAAALTQ